MNGRKFLVILTAMSGLALSPVSSVWADEPKDGHKHEDHEHGAEYKEPKTLTEAVLEIRKRAGLIQDGLDSKQLGGIHEEAQVILNVTKMVGKLAMAKDSGVAKTSVKDVNLAGKEVAAAADAVHDAADKNDLDGTRAGHEKLGKAIEALGKFAPAYACPMDCEPGKFYGTAGKCPVCKMNLKMVTSEKYTVEVKPADGAIKPGEPAQLTFTVRNPAGGKLRKFEVVHEKVMHLLIVSKDLSWYAHEHPDLQEDGTFKLSMTFPQPGEYVLFHDFTPPQVGQQVASVPLTVAGGNTPPTVPLKVDVRQTKSVEGYYVRLDIKEALVVGNEAHLSYQITREGKPVTDLQPYLGAMGHLVIISQDLKHFVHSHPHEHAEGSSKSGDGSVDFEAHFKAPGIYKGWAQFKHRDKVITVPYTLEVSPGKAVTKKGDQDSKADHEHEHEDK